MPFKPLFLRRATSKVHEYQKWEHVDLSDFKPSSCWTGFSYGWLWFLAVVAIAVYAADTFTAVNLLAFNTWPGEIKPSLPFNISKWIFAVCILFSWALCFYEWYRAWRVMRQGSVAKDYLDPLASVLQCTRILPKGAGWKRFLVFAELTKSKKGADYVALFCYFQFKSAIRIVLAQGPRQAINAMTLYAVMGANLIAKKDDQSHSVKQFFTNVRVLGEKQPHHAAILFSMLFTLIIWAVSALCLLVACLLYVGFLWHYIPGRSLSQYCRKKIDKRLRRIVEDAFAKAIDRREAKKRKAHQKLFGKGFVVSSPREAKLPTIEERSNEDGSDSGSDSNDREKGTVPRHSPVIEHTAPPPYANPPPPLFNRSIPPAFRPGSIQPFRMDSNGRRSRPTPPPLPAPPLALYRKPLPLRSSSVQNQHNEPSPPYSFRRAGTAPVEAPGRRSGIPVLQFIAYKPQ